MHSELSEETPALLCIAIKFGGGGHTVLGPMHTRAVLNDPPSKIGALTLNCRPAW